MVIRVLDGLYRLTPADRRIIWQALLMRLQAESRPERRAKIESLMREIEKYGRNR